MYDTAVDKAFSAMMFVLAPVIWGCIVVYDKVSPLLKKKEAK